MSPDANVLRRIMKRATKMRDDDFGRRETPAVGRLSMIVWLKIMVLASSGCEDVVVYD